MKRPIEKWHLEFLVKHSYNGKIQLPRTRVKLLDDHFICDSKYKVSVVQKSNRADVEKFMLNNFYAIAPVPVVLNLYNDEKVSTYLQDELSLWCDRGVSCGIFHNDQVIGAGFNLYVDAPDERPKDISAKDWHNQAAEFALVQHKANPVHVWRNAQFLHLQHLNQQVIFDQGSKFGLHLGCLSLAEEYRGKDGITHNLIKSICNKVWDKGGILTTVANFPAFESYLRQHFPNNIHLLDSVPYKELDLRIVGKKVFSSLESLKNIRYLALLP